MDKLEPGEALGHDEQTIESRGVTRRSFVGYLIAAPTLVAAAELVFDDVARAALPTVQPIDLFDLTDALTLKMPA